MADDTENSGYRSAWFEKGNKYLSGVQQLCFTNRRPGGNLDEPNLHHIIELIFHTIMAFGGSRNVCEMVFEATHQPLKNVLKRNSHNTAHISEVNKALCYDGRMRMRSLLDVLMSIISTETMNNKSHRSLRVFFTGVNSECQSSIDDEDI